jgi:PAS domain S-box-containing protein
MKQNVKCWEFFECKEAECPVLKSEELQCWLVSGTHCRDEIQGTFLEKVEICLDCTPFKANVDDRSLERTLKVVHEQFIEFRRMVEERDRELEAISMELALGLSEVFEALSEISEGDPEVRIPETSDLELITKLKHMVNLTAINLGGIVNLSHEFAIGLAEHFDVLHRVSKGELAARVSGGSQVELLEYLKNVTNQTIESVSREINERKHAEAALKQYRDQLEELVEERTGELTRANELLQQEVRDRQRKEDALRLSEERYRALFMNNPIETIIVDLKGRVTGFNKAKEAGAKEKPADRLPKLGDRMYTKDYAGRHNIDMRRILMNCLKSGESKDFPELQYGSRFLHINISPFSDGAIITSVDITKREQAEAALRASEQKYSSLVQNSLTGIYIDQDKKIVFANKRFAEIYEYSDEELLGMDTWRLVHAEDRALTDDIRTKRLEGKEAPPEYEARGLTKDGEIIWITRRNAKIEYNGKPAILGNIADITERRMAEESLRESEEKYRAVLEASPDPIVVYDMEGKCTYVNPAFTKVFGWSSEELSGKKLDYVPDENWPETQLIIDSVQAGESFSGVESRRYTKDGNTLDVSISAGIHLGRDGIPVGSVHILRDISRRKVVEKALRLRGEELQIQARSLEEVNTALKVLLKRREEDKAELEEKVLSNVKELVSPYVGMLRNTRLDTRQTGYVDIIESSLDDIVSPFLGKLSSKYFALTPREIQIADLIKQGKTSKEIADLLGVSTRAVEFHRENLRRKLGLKNRPANLRSHLLSFQEY